MFPPAVAAGFTVAFAATGMYSLAHYVRLRARTRAGAGTGQARATELLHLLMSVAMIAMAWGRSGGPETGGGVVELVVFGALAAVFVLFAARASGLAGVVGRAAHALMAATMVWMVAATPLLMGHPVAGAAASDEHADHGSMAGMDMGGAGTSGTAPAAAPAWATVLDVALAVALVASGVFWAVRAARAARPGTTVDADVPHAETAAVPGGGVATLAPAAARPAAPARHGRHGVLAASCHTVMSVGMAAMLFLMG